MRHTFQILIVAASVLPACQASQVYTRSPAEGPKHENVALRLDRGDWRVNTHTRIRKVLATRAPNRPPQHVGFVETREYRETRGGPRFRIHVITTRDRDEQVGHIDQMGRGFRYDPQRNGTFETVDVGTNTLELNVRAILQTDDDVILRETNERRLAFEALDANGDGRLQREEAASFGERVTGADTNGDGIVDYEEFEAVDVL